MDSQKQTELTVIYEPVMGRDKEAAAGLERAFEILFEEVLRKRKSEFLNIGKGRTRIED